MTYNSTDKAFATRTLFKHTPLILQGFSAMLDGRCLILRVFFENCYNM